MDNQNNSQHKSVIINGIFTIIVAIISLVGGYLLKDPIENKFFKEYTSIGGVWKPHGDLLMHCNVSTIKDTFYIRMEGTYVSMENWIIQGKGAMDGTSGKFSGVMINSSNSVQSFPIWGFTELAGSNQLGVTVFFDEDCKTQPKIYAFIRESSNSYEIPETENRN